MNTIVKIMESSTNRGVWLVWAKTPTSQGCLRQGFGWKTRKGAEKAAAKAYPGVQFEIIPRS